MTPKIRDQPQPLKISPSAITPPSSQHLPDPAIELSKRQCQRSTARGEKIKTLYEWKKQNKALIGSATKCKKQDEKLKAVRQQRTKYKRKLTYFEKIDKRFRATNLLQKKSKGPREKNQSTGKQIEGKRTDNSKKEHRN